MKGDAFRPILIASVLVLVMGPALVGAQVRYKDEAGEWHFVPSIDDVPPKYRAGAVGGPTAQPSLRSRDQVGRRSLAGQVIFAVDYTRSVMERQGYTFIGDGIYRGFATNYFGAPGADLVVKNGKGEIVGVGKTGADGTFSVMVETSDFYQLFVNYRGRKIEKTLSGSDALSSAIQVDVGRFAE